MLFIPDTDDPIGILDRYRDAMRGGGLHAISHFTTDAIDTAELDHGVSLYRQTSTPFVARTAAEVRALLGDGELVDPGLTLTHQWRPDGADPPLARPEDAGIYAAVARIHPATSPA